MGKTVKVNHFYERLVFLTPECDTEEIRDQVAKQQLKLFAEQCKKKETIEVTNAKYIIIQNDGRFPSSETKEEIEKDIKRFPYIVVCHIDIVLEINLSEIKLNCKKY